ncbi:MAG: hypothetical protein RLO80_02465 [Hyphomonas sp.]
MTHGMTWLAFMTDTSGSRVVYLWRAYLAVILGTMLVAVMAVLVIPQPEPGASSPPPPIVGFALIWPAASTLMLWGILEVTRRLTPTYWHAAGAAMLVFTALFSLAAGLDGGLMFGWGYLFYALTFLAWQLRSNLDGFLMTYTLQASVHLTLSLFVFPDPV